MNVEQTERFETLAHKIQTLGNYPEESIQHSEHSKSYKSRISYQSDFGRDFKDLLSLI